MFFNLYGSAVLMLSAIMGMTIHLLGGLGVTGSSAIDGWLIVVTLAPFFGYILDRSEFRDLFRSYCALTADFFKSISVQYTPSSPLRRVVCFAVPVVFYPWIGISIGIYHWYTWTSAVGPNIPARFTIACICVAIITFAFGWITRDLRLISLDDMPEDSATVPTSAPANYFLVGANLVLAIIFFVLIMIV